MNDISYVLDVLSDFIEDTENNFNPEEVTGKDVITWLGGFVTGMRCAINNGIGCECSCDECLIEEDGE